MLPPDPKTHELISARGALLLTSAVAAAKLNDDRTALVNLDAAGALASSIGDAHNDQHTEFGPTNTVMHRVAILVYLGENAAAMESAAKIDKHALSTERQARLALDITRAQVALTK
jgi:hypothetical protein